MLAAKQFFLLWLYEEKKNTNICSTEERMVCNDMKV